MQTKPKQKLTAILIALTMILTIMMQLYIPLTVHAEESNSVDNISTTYGVQIANVDLEQIYKSGSDYSFNADYYINSNLPFKLVLIKTIPVIPTEDNKEDIFSYLLLENIDNLSLTYNVSVSNIGKDANYSDSSKTYNSSDCSVITNQNNKEYYYIDLKQFVNYESVESSETYDSNFCHSTFMNYDYLHTITYQNGYDPTAEDKLQVLQDIVNGKIQPNPSDDKTFDEVATYDENIPTPKFKVEKNLRFEFLNDESNYYYEIKGRWYTTDDFYLHLGGFMNAIWLYDYDTIYKNDLTDWITYKDKRDTAITGYLKDIGEKSFNDLIKKYPIGIRQITGEKNKDGSYKAGFDHASSNLVMWFKDATSIYNGIEVYIRYYKVDESGNYTYGKWAHYYNGLAKQSGAEVNDNVLNDVEHNYSDKGLTSDELTDLENSGQSKGDTDIITDYGDNGGGILTEIDKLDEINFLNVVKVILSLFQQTKSIFNMFTTVISFMPNWVTELIGVSVVIICLIGIWKALR